MTINCKGELIDLSSPKVMGILNTTPDSFFDGGKYKNEKEILSHVEKMLIDGATFIDVGAYSSRPGADHVSEAEEMKRILPIVELLITNFATINLSIDTFRSNVAKACIASGASIINDISAGLMDDNMLKTVGSLKVPYVMMHMKGTPQNMMQHTNYENLITDITYYFSERIEVARVQGINDIIIDPGFGFSKTLEQNYELLNSLEILNSINLPILAGLSRKSMIYKLLKTDAEKALNGTTALNMIALNKGVKILRVHDVKEAMECVNLANQLQQ